MTTKRIIVVLALTLLGAMANLTAHAESIVLSKTQVRALIGSGDIMTVSEGDTYVLNMPDGTRKDVVGAARFFLVQEDGSIQIRYINAVKKGEDVIEKMPKKLDKQENLTDVSPS